MTEHEDPLTKGSVLYPTKGYKMAPHDKLLSSLQKSIDNLIESNRRLREGDYKDERQKQRVKFDISDDKFFCDKLLLPVRVLPKAMQESLIELGIRIPPRLNSVQLKPAMLDKGFYLFGAFILLRDDEESVWNIYFSDDDMGPNYDRWLKRLPTKAACVDWINENYEDPRIDPGEEKEPLAEVIELKPALAAKPAPEDAKEARKILKTGNSNIISFAMAPPSVTEASKELEHHPYRQVQYDYRYRIKFKDGSQIMARFNDQGEFFLAGDLLPTDIYDADLITERIADKACAYRKARSLHEIACQDLDMEHQRIGYEVSQAQHKAFMEEAPEEEKPADQPQLGKVLPFRPRPKPKPTTKVFTVEASVPIYQLTG